VACHSDSDLTTIINRLRTLGDRDDLSRGFVHLNVYVIVVMGLLHLKGYILRHPDQLLAIGDSRSTTTIPLLHVVTFLHRETNLIALGPSYRSLLVSYCSWVKNLKMVYDRLCARAGHLGEIDLAHRETLEHMFQHVDPPLRDSLLAEAFPSRTYTHLYVCDFSFMITTLHKESL
jgi:hypothetical protein